MHSAILTRPVLPQIELDLVEVEGGGTTPTQFWGRAADGSSVYIRYRGAWLSIYRSAAGDADARRDSELLLQARVGPTLHGTIALEQVSELTGLTVGGKRLSLSEEEFRQRGPREGLVDLSGRRLYIDFDAWARDEDLVKFIVGIKTEFPDVTLLARSIHHGFRYERVELPPDDMSTRIAVVVGCTADHADAIIRMQQLPPYFLEDNFDLVIDVRRGGMPHSERFPKKPIGTYQDIEIAPGQSRRIGLPEGDLASVTGHFEAARERSCELANAILAVADRHFVAEQEVVDLRTDQTVRTEVSRYPRGLSLVDWCRGADDRFLSWKKDDDGRVIAFRPA